MVAPFSVSGGECGQDWRVLSAHDFAEALWTHANVVEDGGSLELALVARGKLTRAVQQFSDRALTLRRVTEAVYDEPQVLDMLKSEVCATTTAARSPSHAVQAQSEEGCEYS